MKNIIRMKRDWIVVLLILMLLGCDSLDITPNGQITMDDVFSNERRTEAFMNTIYSHFPGYGRSYGTTWTFLAGITDDAQDASSGNQVDFCFVTPWISGALTPDYNPLEDRGNGNAMRRYTEFWSGIREANTLLSRIDEVPFSDQSKKSRFISEARLLRAFYYWEMIKQYGAMPIIDEPLSPDVNFTQFERPTFQENVDFILKECDLVISDPNMPWRITTSGDASGVFHPSRFSKAVAYAIKSEASLFNASPLWNPEGDINKWKSAAEISKEALDVLTGDEKYKLAEDYGSYFLSKQDYEENPRDKETILETINGFPGVVSNIPSKDGGWQLGACPTQELVDAYDMKSTGEPAILGYQDGEHLNPIINTSSGYDPQNPYEDRDPRFYATVWYNGAEYDNVSGALHIVETFVGGADEMRRTPPYVLNTHTGYYLRKYIDPRLTTNDTKNQSWKRFRLAEIYLNLAEAENEANNGPTNIAYDAINEIRRRADMPDLPVGLDQERFRERIRNERRVEMPFEESRFWDVRRWKIIDETDKLVTGMEITKTSDGSFSYKRFVTERRHAWDEKFLIFPIPLKDASIIPDFQINQNPGW